MPYPQNEKLSSKDFLSTLTPSSNKVNSVSSWQKEITKFVDDVSVKIFNSISGGVKKVPSPSPMCFYGIAMKSRGQVTKKDDLLNYCNVVLV